MSNKQDKKVKGRKPVEGPHRQVIRAAVINSELFLKALQREKGVKRIKAFLVFPVTAFHLAIMSGCVRTERYIETGGVPGQ